MSVPVSSRVLSFIHLYSTQYSTPVFVESSVDAGFLSNTNITVAHCTNEPHLSCCPVGSGRETCMQVPTRQERQEIEHVKLMLMSI